MVTWSLATACLRATKDDVWTSRWHPSNLWHNWLLRCHQQLTCLFIAGRCTPFIVINNKSNSMDNMINDLDCGIYLFFITDFFFVVSIYYFTVFENWVTQSTMHHLLVYSGVQTSGAPLFSDCDKSSPPQTPASTGPRMWRGGPCPYHGEQEFCQGRSPGKVPSLC